MRNKTRYCAVIERICKSEVVVRKDSLREIHEEISRWEAREDFWNVSHIIKEDWDDKKESIHHFTFLDVPGCRFKELLDA